MKSTRNLLSLLAAVTLVAAILLTLTAQRARNKDEQAYVAEINRYRQEKDQRFRISPFSRLALIHRQYLKDQPRVTIGSGAEADLRLEGQGIAPLHAVIEGTSRTPVLRAQAEAEVWALDNPPQRVQELTLTETSSGFRIGRYNLLYRINPVWGRIAEVFDPEHPALKAFTGLDYFPVDSDYRISGEIVAYEKAERINLIDSHGNEQPYWLYGELRFRLQNTDCRLELYTLTLDPKGIEQDGFMLIFADATSGQESYPAARYLYVEGKLSGRITIDFNRAFSPPCNYSPVFTCPFPRPANRLPVAIRAGEKWYRKTAKT